VRTLKFRILARAIKHVRGRSVFTTNIIKLKTFLPSGSTKQSEVLKTGQTFM
jgi:hypothetical protein